MNKSEYLVVLVSVTDAKAGMALGRALVEERLAGCVQVIPGGTAIYRWHGDETPEILALPVVDGLPAYLRWMDEVVTT
jgi:periplasmic divalent cation tolerance protein